MSTRRAFAIVLALVSVAGCGRDEVLGPDAFAARDAPPMIDAPPLVDAEPRVCTAAAGTADVTLAAAGPDLVFDRLHAGALWLAGPIVGPAPMTISLLFTNDSPFDADAWSCCEFGDEACCASTGVMVKTDAIDAGTEIGDHPATFVRTDDTTVTLTGTLSITSFVHPFLSEPGQIAGSVTATSGGTQVSGTFDNTFCTFLLNVTI